jgi:hypothetical protein
VLTLDAILRRGTAPLPVLRWPIVERAPRRAQYAACTEAIGHQAAGEREDPCGRTRLARLMILSVRENKIPDRNSVRFNSGSSLNVCVDGRGDRRTAMSSDHLLHSSAATSLPRIAAWRPMDRRSIACADCAQVRCGSAPIATFRRYALQAACAASSKRMCSSVFSDAATCTAASRASAAAGAVMACCSPFFCKTRNFCPSCHQNRVLAYSEWVEERVFRLVPHRQYVFTVAKLIRPFFACRPSFLGEFCRIIARSLT